MSLAVSVADATLLADQGASAYKIVVSPTATPTDRFAAEELQLHLKKTTGAELPIVTGASQGGPTVEIGTERACALVRAAFARDMEDEESAVVEKDGTLAIFGGGPVGNAYGVYQFLERKLGCRWLTNDGEEVMPQCDRLDVEGLRLIEKPRLAYRHLIGHGLPIAEDSRDQLFYFRNRMNVAEGNYADMKRADLKGKLVPRLRVIWPGCHGSVYYVPGPDTPGRKGYFKDHPDWFRLNAKGEREPGQVCYSSTGMRETLLANMIAHVKKLGEGYVDCGSAADVGGKLCYCPDCQAMMEKYRSPGGPFYDFVLALAPLMKEACPKTVIHFLAYRREQTNKPPQAGVSRFPDNVAITYAPVDTDFSKNFTDAHNAPDRLDLEAWCKLGNVWMWYYPSSYARDYPPFGTFDRCAVDTRIAAQAGLAGGKYEHDVNHVNGVQFGDAQTWLMLQQYRNPDADWRTLRKEFFDVHYGAASPALIAWSDELEAATRKTPLFLDLMARLGDLYTPENLVRWQRTFDAAERKVAHDPLIVQHVREARFGADLLTLKYLRKISRGVSDHGLSADALRDRLLSTMDRTMERRVTFKPRREKFAEVTKRDRGMITAFHFAASTDTKPLPAEFADIPENRRREICATPADGYHTSTLIKMDDAANGWALRENDVPETSQVVPYPICLYDKANATYVKGGQLNIPQDQIAPNRFKFYKIGRAGIPSGQTFLAIGRSWRLTINCDPFYEAGSDDEWDLYISLKFEGPKYDSSSTGKTSSVYFDRLLAVGPYPRPGRGTVGTTAAAKTSAEVPSVDLSKVSFSLKVTRNNDAETNTVRACEMTNCSVEGDKRVWKGHPLLGQAFTVTATFAPRDGGIGYTFRHDGNETDWQVEEVAFPEWTVKRTEKSKILTSYLCGFLRQPDWSQHKPGALLNVLGPDSLGGHFTALLDDEIGCCYLDQRGEARHHPTRFESYQGEEPGTCVLKCVYEMPLTPTASKSFTLPFGGLLRTFRGGWYDAASIYRSWVVRQKWYQKAAARDFSQLKDVSLWMWNRGTSDVVVPPALQFMKETGLKVALDWYWWHDCPYDTDYPGYWPPREPLDRFTAGIAAVKKAGGYVQPYTNGMLWDAVSSGWEDGGAAGAVVLRDGSVRGRTYNPYTNHKQAWMCGEAPAFQARMGEVVGKLRAAGMSGVYLDMIATCAFGSCFNPAHRHTRGGGRHMTDNYRAYVEKIRKDNPGLYLSSEEESEPYLDLFESLICIYPSYERFGSVGPEYEMVPVFPAVFHGAYVGFGSFATIDGVPAWDEKWGANPFAGDEVAWEKRYPDQFPIEFSRGVIWGLQPTVHKFLTDHMTNPRFADLYAFVKDTARFYHDNRKFLFDGEMLAPGETTCAKRAAEFMHRSSYTRKEEVKTNVEPALPVVFASAWKAKDGASAVVLVNWSRERQSYVHTRSEGTFRGELPPRSWKRIDL